MTKFSFSKRVNSVIWAVNFFLALFFAFSSLRKLIYLDSYKKEISLYPFISKTSAYVIIIVSIYEITLASVMILSKNKLTGLLLSMALFVLMIAYLVLILYDNLGVPVYFGAIIPNFSLHEQLTFNLICVGIIIAVLILYLMNKQQTNSIKPNEMLQQFHV